MGFLNGRNAGEGVGNAGKALFFRNFRKGGIGVAKFLQLVVPRHPQKRRHILRRVHGVAAVDLHRLAGKLSQMLVEHLRVLLLLIRREQKRRLDDV
ncbi:hypothetical protein SDC9_139519 [bioreactor metagenome]|uniref:Uncharacterized protein n=1 Tax=bioreactor metagenome TaxID=1076179 RepID=A0A645DSC6_9ZZZZ